MSGENGGSGSGGGSGSSGTSVLTHPGSKTKKKNKTEAKSGVQTKSKAKGLSKLTKAGAKILSKRNMGRAAMGIGIAGITWTLGNLGFRLIKGEGFKTAAKKVFGIGEVELS